MPLWVATATSASIAEDYQLYVRNFRGGGSIQVGTHPLGRSFGTSFASVTALRLQCRPIGILLGNSGRVGVVAID